MNKKLFMGSVSVIAVYLAGLTLWPVLFGESVGDVVGKGIAWFYVIFTVGFLIYLAATKGWRRVGLVGRDRRPMVKWIVVLWAIQAVLLAGFLLLVLPDYGGSKGLMGFILINVAFVAFNEELLFRGFLWDSLKGWSPAPAILMTSAVFGLSHLVNGFTGDPWRGVEVQVVMAGIGGLFDAVVRFGTGSLWPTIVTHYLWDSSGLFSADTGLDGVGTGIQMLSIAAAVISVTIIAIRYRQPVNATSSVAVVSA